MTDFSLKNMTGFHLLTINFIMGACLLWSAQSWSGTVIVDVVTEPATSGYVRFSGTPEGQVTLPQTTLTKTDLTPGSYNTTVSAIDPALLDASYTLTSIECDDDTSPTPSTGDVTNSTATFNLDTNESVVCLFKLTIIGNEGGEGNNGGGDDGQGNNGGSEQTGTACICPKQGAWNVSNLTGEMVCTGVMPMTMPLKASNGNGHIEVSNGCDTLTASGLSEDEATIIFQRTDNCSYKGTVGGSHEGIPMEIDFTLNVADDSNMSGSLNSVVNQSGMTCTMSRDYNMSHSN